MTTCSYCEENRRSRCSYADCPLEVEQANETIARLQEQLEAANARNVEHEMRLEAEESKSAHWINENRHNLKAGQDAAYKLEAAEARIARLEIVALALAESVSFDMNGNLIGGKWIGGHGGLISHETLLKVDEVRRLIKK